MSIELRAGGHVVIVAGCRARDVQKGTRARVECILELGADYGHAVKVLLVIGTRRIAFYARHRNRLHDPIVAMNDGNPSHKITVRPVDPPRVILR